MENILISTDSEFWIRENQNKFAIDPFVQHWIEKTPEHQTLKVRSAPFLRQGQSDLKKYYDFVEEKYEKYISILSQRLNQVHNKALSDAFWRKTLGTGFYRHITLFYESFQLFETYFDPKKHEAKVLDPTSYQVPRNYDQFRLVFQYEDFGQETLFSLYCHQFSKVRFETLKKKNIKKGNFSNKKEKSSTSRLSRLKDSFQDALKEKYLRPFLYNKLLRRLGFQHSQIKLGVVESYFAPRYLLELENRSHGNIQNLVLPRPILGSTLSLDGEKRNVLSGVDQGFDRFDQFFFQSIEHSFPTQFVEDFQEVYRFYIEYFSTYENLRLVTCESFLSCSYASMALAALKESRGIEHIYNEHNWLHYMYLGNSVDKLLKMVDHYLTLGWSDKSKSGGVGNPRLKEGGSLYRFTVARCPDKVNDVLFVTSLGLRRYPEYNGGYAMCSEGAAKYIKFNRKFFQALPSGVKQRLTYRGYPKTEQGKIWDFDSLFSDQMKEFKEVNLDPGFSAKTLMRASRLVVIDYQSTAYVESMYMNIPTIFFWDPEAYYLEERHADFFDDLLRVGICQSDPEKAAQFLVNVIDHPQKWWNGEEVQRAKKRFLETNFGSPAKMIKTLLEFAES